MDYPRVAIITLNWNQKVATTECVRSLLRLDYPDYEIVIVDNCSTDCSAETFEHTFANVKIIRNTANLGYAGGFNEGIKYAITRAVKYLLIINNDTVIHKGALTALVDTAEADASIGLVTGKVYSFSDPTRIEVVGKTADFLRGELAQIGHGEIDCGQFEDVKEYPFLDDVYWLARTKLLSKVGLYDRSYFIYYEEADLCVRARKAGFRLVYTPRAQVWHHGLLSSGGKETPFNVYHSTRNRIVFMKRNVSPAKFGAFICYSLLVRTGLAMGSYFRRGKMKCLAAFLKGELAGIAWSLEAAIWPEKHV